jgi:hypothetical protein
MTRTRLRIGAGATFVISALALLLLWFESTRHSLILVGPLRDWQLDFLCALLMLVAVAAVILSLARQLSQREGWVAAMLGDGAIALTVVGLAAVSPLILTLGLMTSLTSYWRLGPLDHGQQVVVGEISLFHSQFSVYRGDGTPFDSVRAPPSPTPGDPIVVDHWSVDRNGGQYVISYATTPTSALKALFTLD